MMQKYHQYHHLAHLVSASQSESPFFPPAPGTFLFPDTSSFEDCCCGLQVLCFDETKSLNGLEHILENVDLHLAVLQHVMKNPWCHWVLQSAVKELESFCGKVFWNINAFWTLNLNFFNLFFTLKKINTIWLNRIYTPA